MDALVRSVVLSLAGLAYGYGPIQTTPLILFVFILCAGQGKASFVWVSVFYALALSAIALAAWDYSGSVLWALITFSVPLLINTVVLGAALCIHHPIFRMLGVSCALIALHSPPLASVSVIAPLSIAGALFPGTGLIGIALTLGVIAALSALTACRFRPLPLVASAAAVMGFYATLLSASSVPASEPGKSVGLDTARGMPDEITQTAYRAAWYESEIQAALASGATQVVFPEASLGDIDTADISAVDTRSYHLKQTPKQEQSQAPRVEILRGARLVIDYHHYQQVLVSSTRGIVYRQRQAMPRAFGHSRTAINASSTHTNRVAALICIELTNPWLTLTTFAQAEHQVIWIANLGWSNNTRLAKRLSTELQLWSGLFNKPAITAINYPEARRV